MAARLAARRVADELATPLGKVVGYQVRFEKVGDRGTQLWFLTEGVLTNRLLSREKLPDNSVVIFDEFHERHLGTDVALAGVAYVKPLMDTGLIVDQPMKGLRIGEQLQWLTKANA